MVALIKIVFIHNRSQQTLPELRTLQQVIDKEDMASCPQGSISRGQW